MGLITAGGKDCEMAVWLDGHVRQRPAARLLLIVGEGEPVGGDRVIGGIDQFDPVGIRAGVVGESVMIGGQDLGQCEADRRRGGLCRAARKEGQSD